MMWEPGTFTCFSDVSQEGLPPLSFTELEHLENSGEGDNSAQQKSRIQYTVMTYVPWWAGAIPWFVWDWYMQECSDDLGW
jgi:hypothetical protein